MNLQAVHNLRRIMRLASKTKGMVSAPADRLIIDNISYMAGELAAALGQTECRSPEQRPAPRAATAHHD